MVLLQNLLSLAVLALVLHIVLIEMLLLHLIFFLSKAKLELLEFLIPEDLLGKTQHLNKRRVT